MKTSRDLEIPPKISLLKDLAGSILENGRRSHEVWLRALRENLEIVKDPEEPLLLSNS